MRDGDESLRRWRGWRLAVAAAVAVLTAGALSGCGQGEGGAAAPPASASPDLSPSQPPDDSAKKPAAGKGAGKYDVTDGDPEVPGAAMLRPSDVGSGYHAQKPFDDHWWLLFVMGNCADRVEPNAGSATRSRILSPSDELLSVHQEVTRNSPGGSVYEYLESLGEVLRAGCDTGSHQLSMGDEGFAGERSYLVKDVSDRTVAYYVVLLQGEFTTEIRIETPTVTPDQARSLGKKAAKRLCDVSEKC